MLKSHKFNRNFRGTVNPMCVGLINDRIDDNEHFMLQCHAYREQKRDLLGAMNEVFQLHNALKFPNQAIV